MGNVCCREVSAVGKCPLLGGACCWEVPAVGRCLPSGGLCCFEVSVLKVLAVGKCLL